MQKIRENDVKQSGRRSKVVSRPTVTPLHQICIFLDIIVDDETARKKSRNAKSEISLHIVRHRLPQDAKSPTTCNKTVTNQGQIPQVQFEANDLIIFVNTSNYTHRTFSTTIHLMQIPIFHLRKKATLTELLIKLLLLLFLCSVPGDPIVRNKNVITCLIDTMTNLFIHSLMHAYVCTLDGSIMRGNYEK